MTCKYSLSPNAQADSVQCTCPGFSVPSLVKLWQAFRTYTMASAIAALPKVTCSVCQHTLQCHQPVDVLHPTPGPANSSDYLSPIGSSSTSHCSFKHPQLTLKASAKLAMTPLHNCVHVLPPDGKDGRLVVVLLCSTDSGLRIAVYSSACFVATNGKGVHSGESVAAFLNNASQPETSPEETEMVNNSVSRKGRKQRKVNKPSTVCRRRSARLQERRDTVEPLVREEDEQLTRSRKEREEFCRHLVDCVSSLQQDSCYTSHSLLPEVRLLYTLT